MHLTEGAGACDATVARRVDYELSGLGRPVAEHVCDLIDTIYEQRPGIVAHQRANGTDSASPVDDTACRGNS
ncbi:hypothetical protein [Streptomyces sp. NPDC002588]|uniref:hypothetical protein n=1 Tax=Streptomyces sp. NPDC002588 TaxID=3154419 RepID=UPI003329DF0F